MRTREEIAALAEELFPSRPTGEVMGYLDLYGTESYEMDRERVQYYILKLCGGDFDRLLSLIDDAKRDYRDIIVAAEEPPMSEEEAKRIITKIYEAFTKVILKKKP